MEALLVANLTYVYIKGPFGNALLPCILSLHSAPRRFRSPDRHEGASSVLPLHSMSAWAASPLKLDAAYYGLIQPVSLVRGGEILAAARSWLLDASRFKMYDAGTRGLVSESSGGLFVAASANPWRQGPGCALERDLHKDEEISRRGCEQAAGY
jgi:hypothetical protein